MTDTPTDKDTSGDIPHTIMWDKAKLKKLKHLYGKAVASSKDSFMFDDYEIVTRYAKYLIEYLEERLA